VTSQEEEQNKAILSKVMAVASQMPGGTQHGKENINKLIQAARQEPKIYQWLAYIVGDKYSCQKVAVAVVSWLFNL